MEGQVATIGEPWVAYLVLGVAQAAGLLLIPFWTAGIWLQLGSLALYGWWSDFAPVSPVPLVILLVLTVAAELLEAPLSGGRIDPRIRRGGGIGGLMGAAAGAVVGVPLPLLGSLFGALIGGLGGAFAGVLVSRSDRPGRHRWGSAVGQAIALGTRCAAGVAIATFVIYTLLS